MGLLRSLVLPLLALTALTALTVSVAATATGQDLPRRHIVGLGLEPFEGAARVTAAPQHMPAGQAGVRVGDVIHSANGEAITSQQGMVDWLRRARPASVDLLIERDGRRQVVTVVPQEAPPRATSDFAVQYGTVPLANGVRRRTIITQPHGDGPFPVVMWLGGIGCYTHDLTEPFGVVALLDDLTRAGYLTYWVEKSGMGDSEGPSCADIDFDTELSGYRAGLAQVRTLAQVDPDRIVLMGQSMGGLIGPILAAEAAQAGEPVRAVAGIVTFGVPWFEYLVANSRRQLHLRESSPVEVEARMREAVSAHHAFAVEKRSPAEIVAQRPGTAEIFQYPHHYTYFQQVADYSPLAEWTRAEAPALLVAGGSDFITSVAEHAYIVNQLNELRPGSARFVLIDDMDHWMMPALDARASMRAMQSNETRSLHEQLTPTLLEWLEAVTPRTGRTTG